MSFSTSTSQSIFSITGNAALLKKTYVPKYLFTLARVTSGLVDLLFSMGALVIVMIVTRARFTWYFILFPLVLLQLYLFCIGLGLFLSQANVFFRDTRFLWSVVSLLWTYATPIFYPISIIPAAWQPVFRLNPMYQFITCLRTITIEGAAPDIAQWGMCLLCALVPLALGWWVFRRNEDQFVFHL